MPCLDAVGNCTRAQFPKMHRNTTVRDKKGWVQLRRRQPRTSEHGTRVGETVKRYKGKLVTFNNESVVPYNPFLTLKYNCHINVEYVNTSAPVKYLFKYFCKGPSVAAGAVKDDKNEIKAYVAGLYMTACNAAWNILGFPIFNTNVSIVRLPVHLPGEQTVVYEEHTTPAQARDASSPYTKLIQFFKWCRDHKNSGDKYFYEDISRYATWKNLLDDDGNKVLHKPSNTVIKHWGVRKRQTGQLSRIQPVPYRLREKFYLRSRVLGF